MCVIENKTYIYTDQHRETVRKQYRCHNAPSQGLCKYVEERNTEAARVVERRPDSGRPSSMSQKITTADGREYRYFPLSRRSSKRSSTGKASDSGRQSPIDSLVSSSPPHAPKYRTVRPPAPSPPPTRSTRRVSFHEPDITSRQQALDGTAVYSGPPSLSMPRAAINERHSLDRRSSISSLTNEVDDTELPQRRSSMKRDRRPSELDLSFSSKDATTSSQSSPGLSELPRIYREPPDSGWTEAKQRAQRDASYDDDERQARLVRDRLAATDQRQSARETRYSARKYSEDLSREPSLERKASQRRRTAAALAGGSAAASRQQDIDRESERRYQAELAQLEREKIEAADRRRRTQYQESPRTPPSARTYTYTPSSPASSQRPRISARTMTYTSSPAQLARPSRYGTPIVHQPNPPRDLLAEQGERVIAREQARANEEARIMTERLNSTRIYDEAYEDGL
ncbi:hypothetical protein Slin14017_G039050 [Septoria linicola]|nr:hypothetical protein Slin14017_G039050 [Septoria linicola]